MSELIETLKSERGKKNGVAVLLSGLSAMFFFCGYDGSNNILLWHNAF